MASNPDHVVVVGRGLRGLQGRTPPCPLLQKYENLLVVMTYSKSRSMAGARLGFALGSRALIQDLRSSNTPPTPTTSTASP